MESIIQMEKISDILERYDDLKTYYDCLYEIYVLIGVAKGVDDVNNGRGMPLKEYRKEREKLYERYNRRFG